MITIASIDDPLAGDIDMLVLAITISSIVILLLQLSLKVVGNSRVFPVLPLTQKLLLAFSHTQRPVTVKTYLQGNSTDSLFTYPREPSESAIKAQQKSLPNYIFLGSVLSLTF